MPNYKNTVIYKIKHNKDYDDINIYVGSTTNFRVRKNQHKTSCNNENNKDYNMPIYQYIRANSGWDNFVMVPIEEYPCNCKNEKEIKERYYIDLLRPKLNKIIPCRSEKEWRKDNKDKISENGKIYRKNNKEKIKKYNEKYHENNKKKISEQKKEYHENNKEKIKEKQKEYRENNKEKISQQKKIYYENNKEKKKEYNEKNKDKFTENKKKWYENNKDKINEKAKEKVECKCGSIVCKKDIKIHERTQKHKNFMLSLNKTE